MANATGAIRLLWLLPILPAAGFAINTVVGRRLRLLAGWLSTLLVGAAFVLAVAAFFALLSHGAGDRVAIVHGPRWFTSGSLRVGLDLRLDPLSVVMTLVVTGVSTLIHLYSIGYMAHDERPWTFFAYMNLFVASMLLLVLGENFLVTFLGWEGVGLCSYLLVGYWYDRADPPPAAKKAFITNRIGDVGFLLAMFLIVGRFSSLDYSDVLARAGGLPKGTATAIALLLFLACVGKSAQIPLYVWLPDAMAGPTPVSALIHAATMVTAGVYLVARTHVFFEVSGTAQTVVVVIGACTALLAALIAVAQDDIKKILAYSTVSQLGYMFIAVGVGPIGYALAIFHLVTHAFFKAQLFLGAGSVMHANAEDTDVKHFGGLRAVMPITFWTTAASCLAIAGIFPFAGFWSKDQILGAAFGAGGVGRLAWLLGLVTAALTAFYMGRLLFLTFFGESRWPQGRHPHESPPLMTLPLVILGALAVVAGVLNLRPETGVLHRFLQPVFASGNQAAAPSTPEFLLSTVAVLLALVAGALAWYVYASGRMDWMALRARFGGVRRVLAGKFYVDEIYQFFTVTIGGAVAAFLAVTIDRRVIDGAVNRVAGLVGLGARGGRRVQSGLVRTYALGVLGGAVALLAFLVLRPT